MNDFLARMETSSRIRLAAARGIAPLESVRRQAAMIPTTGLPSGFLLFAEIKPTSPAEGSLATSGFRDLVRAYESGGAAAISVLTEPTEFGGSMELIEEIVESVSLPVMRKDFIVDPYQVWEARARGASGALAIARMLDAETLEALAAAAGEAEMFLLVEAFDETDIDAISALDLSNGHLLVGVNSRDLTTLQVRPDAHEALGLLLPDDCVAIAESGINSPEQVKALTSAGYHGVLVGTSLMRSDDPAGAVASLVEAGVS
ncbi:MAG: indole-3-glycerol phosphate synthase TrpC [Acidimicrobiia bacterium]